MDWHSRYVLSWELSTTLDKPWISQAICRKSSSSSSACSFSFFGYDRGIASHSVLLVSGNTWAHQQVTCQSARPAISLHLAKMGEQAESSLSTTGFD
jgi:hypothetical protein